MSTLDIGEQKKDLCFKLGAEKWVDFRESQDVIQDVMQATGGLGPHAAILTAGDVRFVFVKASTALMFMLDDILESSPHVPTPHWDCSRSGHAWWCCDA